MLLRVLELLLPVRRGERALAGTLFLHSFFAVGAFLTGRTVRDALFLAHGDRAQLAWMYVASAVGVTSAGLLWGPLAVKLRRDLAALASGCVFSATFVLFWAVERSGEGWVYSALYVFVEVMGALVLVQFWTLANELFNAREAKRLYGLIGAGGTVANIVVGLLAARIATHFGASALLWLGAGLLLGTAATSYVGGRVGKQRLFARAATGRPSSAKRAVGASRVLQSPHLRIVAVLAAVTFFTTTLVDYQFKVIAAASYPADALAAFFGYFSVGVGVLALSLQLFGTSKLLNRIGVVGSLAVLPAFLLCGNLALGIFPLLWAASFTKGSDTLFRYSVNDATTQILYLPVPAQVRTSAKAFIDGVIKPLAVGCAGLFLAGWKVWMAGAPHLLPWVSLALCAAWLGVVARMRKHYLTTLQDNLKNRRLDLESARHQVLDGSTSKVFLAALTSSEPREVLNALALLPHLQNLQLDNRVEPLLQHPSAEVRIASLEYYGRRQTMRFANSVFRCFEDPHPAVRAAAIDAFSALGQDKAVKSVRPFLADPDPRIRSAAVTGMIRYGGLDGVLVAAEALKQLISNPDPVMREQAAKVLGAVGVKNFYQPVLQLMNDPEPRVQRQAIIAAGVLKSSEFVIPLIYRTKSVDTTHEAVDALTAFGEPIVPTLAKVLSNALEDPTIRRAVARVLGRLGTSAAVEVVSQHLADHDEELRSRLYRALARAIKGHRAHLPDPRPVQAALDAELLRAYEAMHQAQTLGLGHGPHAETPLTGEEAARALLASALQEKVVQTERRIFTLLAVLYPEADMEQIYAGIHDAMGADAARRRGNAVELLDNLLERELKRRFLPLLDELPRADRLKLVEGLFELQQRTPGETLVDLCRDESPWVRACALWCVAQAEAPVLEAEALLHNGVADPSAVVREICLVSIERQNPERAVKLAESKLRDEAPAVRQQAALITARRALRASAGFT